MKDFGGNRINFVQAGLGTNCTFIQNFAGKKTENDSVIRSLSTLLSNAEPSTVTGISVEPVACLIRKLKHYMPKLKNACLLHAALGEEDIIGETVHAFTQQMCEEYLCQVPPAHREGLAHHMQYLLNMSHVGMVHPNAENHLEQIRQKFNIDIPVEQQQSDVWTWSKLVETYNFKGCEVLLLDTEGHDAQILRSMISHCSQSIEEWPHFIQFESMGLCDALEGKGSEKRVVRELEKYGYVTIMLSNWNTYLVHGSAMGNPKIKKWVKKWFCDVCKQFDAPKPFTSDAKLNYCAACSNSWTTEQRAMAAAMPPCLNPECEYPANPDVQISDGFCCEKCEGRFKGEDWAMNLKKEKMHTACCTSKDSSIFLDPKVLLGINLNSAFGGYGPVKGGKCKHPGCNFMQNSDPWISNGYCCEKCEGLHKGEAWAEGGKRHYKSCEQIPCN